MDVLFLALKELRYEKTRYALVAGIMFLISFLVLFVSGLAQGLAFNNASSLETMNVDHFVLDKEAEHQLTRSLVSDEDQQVIEDGEVDATPFGLHMTMLIREEASNVDVAMMSVDLNSPIAPTIIEGQTPSEGQALIHESIKRKALRLEMLLRITLATWNSKCRVLQKIRHLAMRQLCTYMKRTGEKCVMESLS